MSNDNWGSDVGDSLDGVEWGNTGGADGFGDFDTEGVDAGKVGSGRVQVGAEGYHRFVITQADARPGIYGKDRDGKINMTLKRRPDILLTCTVLAGPSPRDSVYFHNLIMGGRGGGQPTENDKVASLNFLCGVGILINDGNKVIDPETGTTKINAQTLTQRLSGLQFIGNIKHQEKSPKKDDAGNEIPGEFWPEKYSLPFGRGAYKVDDPQVAHLFSAASQQGGQQQQAKPVAPTPDL